MLSPSWETSKMTAERNRSAGHRKKCIRTIDSDVVGIVHRHFAIIQCPLLTLPISQLRYSSNQTLKTISTNVCRLPHCSYYGGPIQVNLLLNKSNVYPVLGCPCTPCLLIILFLIYTRHHPDGINIYSTQD